MQFGTWTRSGPGGPAPVRDESEQSKTLENKMLGVLLEVLDQPDDPLTSVLVLITATHALPVPHGGTPW